MATPGLWDQPPPPESPEFRTPRDDKPPGPRVLTVAEVTRTIRDAVRHAPGLGSVWVEGEVGQVSLSAAGHCYFTLKDERTQLRCMIFRGDRTGMPLEPRTGIRIVAHGRVDIFEPQGAYQLYVDGIQPAGLGDLALRFEALKAQLMAEGLFDTSRKRALPAWPRTIGIVTSPSGAVLHDIHRVVARRWPLTRLIISPCLVQGAGAPRSIVAALQRIGRWTDAETGSGVDVVIVARGGGSLEDLWAFNEEPVVRAIAASPRPIIVGVGHETDVTLAEFAADVRAATPSVAAELAVPDRLEQRQHLRALETALAASAARRISSTRARLESEWHALQTFRPDSYLAAERERIGLLLDRATRAFERRLLGDRATLAREGERLPALLHRRVAGGRAGLTQSAAALAALDPFATLERGYAMVRTADGRIVVDAAQQQAGDQLEVRLARGVLDVSVDSVRDSGS